MIVDWWVDVEDETPSACMTGRADSDEMTENDWDRYAHDFEARYNEHMRSLETERPRRVGRACGKRIANRYYYDDNDDIGYFLPTEEEIAYLRKSLMPDPAEIISRMARPHEDTMASFFLENW